MNRNVSFSKGLPYGIAITVLHFFGLYLFLTSVHDGFMVGGIGLIAYTLGLRHAFDVDHIAAIDNSIRKLMQDRQNPSGAGFFFSLGHSSVVFIMALITALFLHWSQSNLPSLQRIGGMLGMFISGGFLLLIGFLNLMILKGIFKAFAHLKKEGGDASSLDELLLSRGLISRLASPLFRLIRKSWHLYPLGFLFGLGFDTASEIAILSFSVEAVKQEVPLSGLLSLPLLFASGMSLMDTADGLFMQTAYRWAFSTPLRKIYYNLTLTIISIAAAILIGAVEWSKALFTFLQLKGGFSNWIEKLSLNWLGYALVALFAAVWIFSFLAWKVLKMEKRYGSKEV